MEKRFFIALVLSFLAISVYSWLKGPQRVANKKVTSVPAVAARSAAQLGQADQPGQVGQPELIGKHGEVETPALPGQPDQTKKPGEIGQPVLPGQVTPGVAGTLATETVAPPLASGPGRPDALVGSFESSLFNEEAAETATFETEKLVVTISKIGGYIKNIDLKDPPSRLSFCGVGAVRAWTGVPFVMRRTSDGFVLEYRTSAGGEIVKTFSFDTPLSLSFSVSYNGITDLNSNNYDILIGAVSASKSKDPIGLRYLELSFYGTAVARRPLYRIQGPLVESADLGWLGLRDRYFCLVVVPDEPGLGGVKAEPVSDYRLVWAPVKSLQSVKARIYFGPQDEKALRRFEEGAQRIVSYGTFDLIAKPLSLLLKLFQRVTKNWGLAIIVLTIIVYTILSPLSLKSMKSMRRMQALQPQVEALKEKLKDNPQKLNAEIMELYRREQVNPFGGCLPIFMQIPVFYSLYQVLVRSIELKGQRFLWIKDLSEPDRLFRFGFNLPFVGSDLNLLPILMAGLMVLQQKITMKSSVATSPEMAQQQKIMGMVMPVVFGVLFYNIQSGLVLYWFTNSLLSVVFQWKVNKSVTDTK